MFPGVRYRGGRRGPIRHVDFERQAMNVLSSRRQTLRDGHQREWKGNGSQYSVPKWNRAP